MRVAIVGTGYVGLVSGVCLAKSGHRVTCIDQNARVVESLNRGIPHIHEDGLGELLEHVCASESFFATTSMENGLATADLAMVAVGTPSIDGRIDLTQMLTAADEIGRCLSRRKAPLPIIIKSTVVPASTDGPIRAAIERASGLRLGQFGLGMNPEFLREGAAIEDFMHPDRIVLGYDDPAALEALEELYAPWACKKLRVNTRTAELIKYANNALLATQISAMNEIANVAAALGEIDVLDVLDGVRSDRRWSPRTDGRTIEPGITSYLVPGCGFGGSCFPKDLQALRACGQSAGLPMHMLSAVLAVNEEQPDHVIDALRDSNGSCHLTRVLVLGLAFKPGTDDVRESVSLRVVDGLLREGVRVMAHDPIAIPNFRTAAGPSAETVEYWQDWRSSVAQADAIILLTAWPEYRRLVELDLAGKVVFDGRRMFRAEELTGAKYLAIGRGGPST